ncbi:MAG: tyrosine-type recombinase/integrase [Bacteroidota bacterium]
MNLQSFEYYLMEDGLRESTAMEHVRNIERFLVWVKENELTGIEQMKYNELLTYVQYLKSKSLSIATINIRICSLRKYYEHLKQEGIIENNPARRMHLRGNIKKIVAHPLTYNELEQLYSEYAKPKEHYREEKHKAVHRRNSVILGLMIWQAVHSGELYKIEIQHVKLEEGTIYIQGCSRSKSRQLKLDSKQIIALHTYISETSFTNEKLFSGNLRNVTQSILNEVRGINPVIRNASHIRCSIILHWLKMYSKRQAQYMIGHKWISSTEHYQEQEIDGLTDLLSKHHPFQQ